MPSLTRSRVMRDFDNGIMPAAELSKLGRMANWTSIGVGGPVVSSRQLRAKTTKETVAAAVSRARLVRIRTGVRGVVTLGKGQ